MTGLAERVRDFFVVPPRSRAPVATAPVPPVVFVLGDTRLAPALAAATALGLARTAGASHAAVCLWPGDRRPAGRLPAFGAARRGAARLAARGCVADASVRLARAHLPEPAGDAAAALRRLIPAAACPVAVALRGPRDAELDAVLVLADAVLLARRADEPPGLTRLAQAGLAGLGIPVLPCDVRIGAAGAALATSGLVLAPSARAATGSALEALARDR
jgi:hypothetical protein